METIKPQKRKRSIYTSARGWSPTEFTVEYSVGAVCSYRGPLLYEVWKDGEGLLYWVILNQVVDHHVLEDSSLIERILKYSQEDNWVVETFLIEENCCITKFYPNYFPVFINNSHEPLYGKKKREEREQARVSYFTDQNRKDFRLKAIDQYKMFSDRTNCFFEDVAINNFLASEDFKDIKIIDVCSIQPGHITDQVAKVDSNNDRVLRVMSQWDTVLTREPCFDKTPPDVVRWTKDYKEFRKWLLIQE